MRKKLIRIFAIMTIVIGIVDLIQIIFQIPILPTYDLMFDSSTGLYRFFNYPKFTEFFPADLYYLSTLLWEIHQICDGNACCMPFRDSRTFFDVDNVDISCSNSVLLRKNY